jgi:ferric-dicitrate binding protein FerR (iron transport regulator)
MTKKATQTQPAINDKQTQNEGRDQTQTNTCESLRRSSQAKMRALNKTKHKTRNKQNTAMPATAFPGAPPRPVLRRRGGGQESALPGLSAVLAVRVFACLLCIVLA